MEFTGVEFLRHRSDFRHGEAYASCPLPTPPSGVQLRADGTAGLGPALALGRSIEQRELFGIWALDPVVPEGDERRVDARCVVGQGAIALRDSGRQHLRKRVE